ncbi:MAG: PIN domain-containing protein [Chloroflexi bacterium]|nr:PIN domain-containing protein [Chloroflexota bacterium]
MCAGCSTLVSQTWPRIRPISEISAVTRLAIVDTGPLVAFLDRRDARHAWTRERLWELDAPLLVCEPVLTEALFLLRRFPQTQDALLGQVRAGRLRIAFSLTQEIESIRRLLAKYADRPMSLADACLVRMAELHNGHSICTLDADFHVYRKHGREPIPLIVAPS